MGAHGRYDVIVVGAGIMGSCAAHFAASHSSRPSVLLLEQFDLLHHLGSSHGESRTLRATYPEPYYPPLVHYSLQLWEAAQLEAGYRVLTRTAAHVDLGPKNDPALAAVVDNSEAELVDSVPVFQVPTGWTAVRSSVGAIIKPTKAVAMFQALALKKGVVFRDRTAVVNLRSEGGGGSGVCVTTERGEEFVGSKCIITAGAWTRKLILTASGVDLPIQPLHTLICYWKIKDGREEELTPAAGFPTFSSYGDPFIYGTPSMEYPGLIKIAVHGGPPCDPDRRDWDAGAGDNGGALVEPLKRWIQTVMPQHVDAASGPASKVACMYSMTPDEDFVIDYVGGGFGKDVVVGGGFSGHGFKMAPALGKILAEMAIDGAAAVPSGVDLRHFGIGRFAAGAAGNAKNFRSS